MRTSSNSACLEALLAVAVATAGCGGAGRYSAGGAGVSESPSMQERIEQYAIVRLEADLSGLTENERKMIPLLIEAARQMDEVFWLQACGDRDALLAGIRDSHARRFAEFNYGPWDRLNDNRPFVSGVGAKPPGAGFYPVDMTKDEFERHLAENPTDAETFRSEYTVIRRDSAGRLRAIPYHEFYAGPTRIAADKLRAAAALANDAGLRRYLELRAEALLTDRYRDSDFAWLDMKNNTIDCVIGPIETYEDRLFGYKAAHEAYILVKDKAWSARLSKYAALLPDLQRDLPVPDTYKTETPGTDSDLNAYDVLFYAGDCNAGSKTIAINLPNDEQVQLKKGTRRLQLKNAMRAKFDKILVPIADLLVADDQRPRITFDAFFGNTMFHEVAHGLGVKNTINGRGTVRDALKDRFSALEEAKADVLGLYMVTRLFEQGVLTEGRVEDHYVTFMAGIFRSVRFGAASAHGNANMLAFNFLARQGAFSRDERSGRYRVNFEAMKSGVEALAAAILKYQGDGDYDGVGRFLEEMARVGPDLRADLDRIVEARIPVDIVFEQGLPN